MGKGALVAIRNFSSSALTISYSNFVCMYQNGDQKSDFGPISGPVAPREILPRPGTDRQYIEANASFFGGCSMSTSTFTMNVQGPAGMVSIFFSETGNAYAVNPGQVVQNGLSVSTTLYSGKQYRIDVLIRDGT